MSFDRIPPSVFRLLDLLADKPNVLHQNIPPDLGNALRIGLRQGLVDTQKYGIYAESLKHDAYRHLYDRAYWLSPEGKDALAWHRETRADNAVAENAEQPRGERSLEEHMAQVVQAVGDEMSVRIMAVANQKDLSGEERMKKIILLDCRYARKKSTEWSKLLCVSDAAIRGYKTWKVIQDSKDDA